MLASSLKSSFALPALHTARQCTQKEASQRAAAGHQKKCLSLASSTWIVLGAGCDGELTKLGWLMTCPTITSRETARLVSPLLQWLIVFRATCVPRHRAR